MCDILTRLKWMRPILMCTAKDDRQKNERTNIQKLRNLCQQFISSFSNRLFLFCLTIEKKFFFPICSVVYSSFWLFCLFYFVFRLFVFLFLPFTVSSPLIFFIFRYGLMIHISAIIRKLMHRYIIQNDKKMLTLWKMACLIKVWIWLDNDDVGGGCVWQTIHG